MAKTKLGKSVNDAGWAQFVSYLDEACTRKGVSLSRVPRFYPSSQICSSCGKNGGRKALAVRTWECDSCRAKLGRDYNAAVNILAAGLAVNACGRDVRHQLAGAGPGEAGSRRSETRASASRRRSVSTDQRSVGASRQIQIRGKSTICGTSWIPARPNVENVGSPLLRPLIPYEIGEKLNIPLIRETLPVSGPLVPRALDAPAGLDAGMLWGRS